MNNKVDVFYDVEKLRQDVMTHRIITLNCSGNELATISKVGRHSISKIENRKPVGIGLLMQICRAMNKDYTEYLIKR